jgi:anti-sigma B factor antagonist
LSAAVVSPLRLDGELTVQSAAEHKAIVLAALDAGDVIELDLSGVSELDTAGLQLLLLLKREAEHLGKSLRLSASSEAVLEVLALAHLDVQLERIPAPALPEQVVVDQNRGAR